MYDRLMERINFRAALTKLTPNHLPRQQLLRQALLYLPWEG